ncbi:GntR family transcriptional regulator [Kineosporia sp. J2-2]|uniref:GntR family transcriptional regulator n=1 Tax=Kineosporia corallincola TaxID=2835133 RepID=A0ABS5TM52_9ACTN|nr:GntR family transcriptional regulator [Kineosporia corallincola]MBT0771251.1 GntR family transcriptional regulator [Kineosporia corallincola]
MGKPPTHETTPTNDTPTPATQSLIAGHGAPDRTTRALRARLPRYEQIALTLRERIETGELPPGEAIPSETAMIAEFGVSRITVRHAIAALRAAGLITTEHGRASRVRETHTIAAGNSLEFDPTIVKIDATDGPHYRTWDTDGWAEVETPSRYRTNAGIYAEALAIPPAEPVFVLERQLLHTSGAQVMHRTWLPFAIVDDLHLEDDPFRLPTELYQAFTDAGHTLAWTDRTRAEMPRPDDAATLNISPGVPLIIHVRTTQGRESRPLLVEETRIPADRATLLSFPA